MAGTLENFFGNTVVVRAADGQETRYRYKADGAYSASLVGGATINGTWANTSEGLTLTPAGGGAPRTFKVPEGKQVGDTWTVPSPAGEFSIKLVAGQ